MKEFVNGSGRICCRGSHLCRDCYTKLRRWSYAEAVAEFGEVTAANHAAILKRIKELEHPLRKEGIRN